VSLADLLEKSFAVLSEHPPTDALAARVATLLGDVKPAVSGSTVTIDLDQDVLEPMATNWYLNMTRAVIAVPSRPARSAHSGK
jgi:hypothetical protein